jgi:hypothetical protein
VQPDDLDLLYHRRNSLGVHASKEKKVITSVIPIIEGETREIPFNNFDSPTDGKLTSAKPDLFYGARPEQLDRRIRDEGIGERNVDRKTLLLVC